MTIDHITLGVTDYERSKRFYTAALAPLGIALMIEGEGRAGFGRPPRPQFWFGSNPQPGRPIHIALAAASRREVDAFYRAALAAGGKDNGAPGIRAIYHPSYYGAFVIDPDGHNVEAVCHRPE